MAHGLLKVAYWYMPIFRLPASLTLVRDESIMQDPHPDTESQRELLRLAQKAVQDLPECRESRIADVQRALDGQTLMLKADVLASRLLADPLHHVHCDL